RPPQPLPLRPAVQGGHRAAALPVRHPAPRRTRQATPASRNRPFPGGGRRPGGLLGPEPVLESLQAPRRRHAGAVPDARHKRPTPPQAPPRCRTRPPYHSSGAGQVGMVAPRAASRVRGERTRVASVNLEVFMKTNLCHMLGIENPIIAAPMGPDLTGPDLVAAVSNAGGLGILQAQLCPPPLFRQEIRRVRALTDRPFGVNLILHFPLHDHIAVCLEE